MAKNHIRNICLITLVALFWACKSDDKGFLPGYSGSFGEVVLVMPNQMYQGDLGDTVIKYLNAEQYGFPQSESCFTLIQVDPTKFQSVLKSHRSVILLKVDKSIGDDHIGLKLSKNKWARGQVVLTINARNRKELAQQISLNSSRAIRVIQNAEINRLVARNKKFGSKELNREFQKVTGLSIQSQKDWEVEIKTDSTIWLRLERERTKGGFAHQISQGMLVFWKPYTDKLQFLDTNLYTQINAQIGRSIPGPGEGQFMQVENNYVPPQSSEKDFKGTFAKETRGIWRMEGNFMGGPFYCLTFLDEENERVVYVYGFVYSPQFDKREYLREIEAMALSIQFPNPT